MAFKSVKQSAASLDSPEALFRDLRQRTIPAPHALLTCYQQPDADKRHHKQHQRFWKHKAPPAQLPTVLRVRPVAGFEPATA